VEWTRQVAVTGWRNLAVAGSPLRGRQRGLVSGATLLLVVMLLGVGAAGAQAASPSYFNELTGTGQALNVARKGAVAAPLPNGEVLIAGGVTSSGYLSSAELFNPAGDTFTSLSGTGQALNFAREGAVAALLPNGEVLIAGGYGNSGILSSAELFNPAGDTFTSLSGTGQALTVARAFAVAAPLPNGEVLIAGGYGNSGYLSSAELFNPAGDTFTSLTGTGQALTVAREGAVAALLPNGEVLIAGGYNGSVLLSAELFNPVGDTFTSLSGTGQALTVARAYAVAALLPNGEVLIAGGDSGSGFLSSAELFNPAGDTFTSLTGTGQALNVAREAAVAALLPNGEVLIAGGDSGSYLSSAELFSTAAQAAVAGGAFGDQTVSEPSVAQALVVTNIGAQALSISGATVIGTNATNFAVTADACVGRTLVFEQTCTITVQFTPSASGLRSASLTLTDNEATPASVTLSGTGVAANSGPAGTNGTNGAQGSAGAQGPAGANGEIELVKCTTVKAKKKTSHKCTTSLVSSPVSFTTSSAVFRATLSHDGRVAATGTVRTVDGRAEFVSSSSLLLAAGHYTLTVTHKTGRHTKTTRESITIT
jgi:hypothetical protein